MMSGAEYIQSLRDGRRTFFDAVPVESIADHPVLGPSVQRAAAGYDVLAAENGEPSATNPLMVAPKSGEDLRERIPLLHRAGTLASVTHTSLMTLATLAETGLTAPYDMRIRAFLEDAGARDVRMAQCITDAKGDRSLRPSLQPDPDAYVRVVEQRHDGIVIRGAKLHVTGASLAHELMVIPTKSMRSNEREYAVACAVSVAAPGLYIVDATYARRDDDSRSAVVSSQQYIPDGCVIFDDVFVPHERVFLNGEFELSANFAHTLGLWERLGGLAKMARDYDVLVGFAHLLAEANGLLNVAHIKEKISEMIIHATLVRAALDAALSKVEPTDSGTVFPDQLFTNVGKYYGAAQYHLMVRHIHDIAGGSVVTAPSEGDLQIQGIGRLLQQYFSTPSASGNYRVSLFQAVRDATASDYGGWREVSNLQGGGGLFAQRVVARMHYPMDKARALALEEAALEAPRSLQILPRRM